jgi:hypothetical protein
MSVAWAIIDKNIPEQVFVGPNTGVQDEEGAGERQPLLRQGVMTGGTQDVHPPDVLTAEYVNRYSTT